MKRLVAVVALALAGCGAPPQHDAMYLERDLPRAYRENGNGGLREVQCIRRTDREYSCQAKWTPPPSDEAGREWLRYYGPWIDLPVLLDPETGEYNIGAPEQ